MVRPKEKKVGREPGAQYSVPKGLISGFVAWIFLICSITHFSTVIYTQIYKKFWILSVSQASFPCVERNFVSKHAPRHLVTFCLLSISKCVRTSLRCIYILWKCTYLAACQFPIFIPLQSLLHWCYTNFFVKYCIISIFVKGNHYCY